MCTALSEIWQFSPNIFLRWENTLPFIFKRSKQNNILYLNFVTLDITWAQEYMMSCCYFNLSFFFDFVDFWIWILVDSSFLTLLCFILDLEHTSHLGVTFGRGSLTWSAWMFLFVFSIIIRTSVMTFWH